eukprot:TRINITY_DN1301_c0_g1_i12.p1 TRINITY_DN1301_c0_g1~~TRINITY_DN1301_c0_g1_i12.p1  ORF type:complete len:236 (+),score=35.17 TRINITY_DN1301_c0_g1_i12:480-1187(+)
MAITHFCIYYPVLHLTSYLRMASTMDSQRASEGGKANGWRPLFGSHPLSAATQAMLALAPEFGSVATGYTPRIPAEQGAGGRLPVNAKVKRRPLTKGEKAKKLVQRLLASKEREIGTREHTALVNAAGTALAEADVDHVVTQAERIQARVPQGYTQPAARQQERGQQHVRVSAAPSSPTIKLPHLSVVILRFFKMDTIVMGASQMVQGKATLSCVVMAVHILSDANLMLNSFEFG